MTARVVRVVVAVLLVAAVACSTEAGDGAERGLCCECACSTADGTECLSLTFDSSTPDDGAQDCPSTCAAECSAHPECPVPASAVACAVAAEPPRQAPGSGPEHPSCNPVDDDNEPCKQATD